MDRYPGLLLLGPTGVGKTPLGDMIEWRGLWEHRCVHFDFGAQLRGVAAGTHRPPDLMLDEMASIVGSLRTGALLEDHQFPIAAKILREFARTRGVGRADRIVLNGLPRHVGQAGDVARVVRIEAVVNLHAAAEVVRQRINLDSGGDRAGRVDDSPDDVARKLAIYESRTAPLLEHYRMLGIPILRIEVDVATSAEQCLERLAAMRPSPPV